MNSLWLRFMALRGEGVVMRRSLPTREAVPIKSGNDMSDGIGETPTAIFGLPEVSRVKSVREMNLKFSGTFIWDFWMNASCDVNVVRLGNLSGIIFFLKSKKSRYALIWVQR